MLCLFWSKIFYSKCKPPPATTNHPNASSNHQPPKNQIWKRERKPATTMTYHKLPTITSHRLKIRALNHKSEYKTTNNPQIWTLNHQISTNPTKPLQKTSKIKQKKTLTNLDQKPKTCKPKNSDRNLRTFRAVRWEESTASGGSGRSQWVWSSSAMEAMLRERERRSAMEAMSREKERERWSAMMVVADENLGKGMVPWQRGWWGVRCKKFYTCFKWNILLLALILQFDWKIFYS